MRFKLGTAAAIIVLAGLVFSSTPATDTARAHGSHNCHNGYVGPHVPWPGDRKISANEIKWFSVMVMNLCYLITAEPSGPNADSFSFIRRVSNSAGEGYLRTWDGVRHRCKVDHDQVWANGQWHTGFNASCVQS